MKRQKVSAGVETKGSVIALAAKVTPNTQLGLRSVSECDESRRSYRKTDTTPSDGLSPCSTLRRTLLAAVDYDVSKHVCKETPKSKVTVMAGTATNSPTTGGVDNSMKLGHTIEPAKTPVTSYQT